MQLKGGLVPVTGPSVPLTLSLFSLVFLFPWSFLPKNSLGVLSVSCLFCRVSRVRTVRKILGIFEVLFDVFEKTKEKKDREGATFPPSGLGPLVVPFLIE